MYLCMYAYIYIHIFREILSINKDFLLKSINQLTFILDTQCLREVRNEILKVRSYV